MKPVLVSLRQHLRQRGADNFCVLVDLRRHSEKLRSKEMVRKNIVCNEVLHQSINTIPDHACRHLTGPRSPSWSIPDPGDVEGLGVRGSVAFVQMSRASKFPVDLGGVNVAR